MSQDLSRPINELIAAFDEQEGALVETIRKANVRLEQVRAARMSLLALESDEPLVFDGKLADAIRVVLKTKDRSHVPVEVRDQVKALGYDFSEHKNQMAAIHGVLKRMVESGEVKTKEWSKQPGVVRYYWQGWDHPSITVPVGKMAMTGHTPSVMVGPIMTADEIEAAKQAPKRRHSGAEEALQELKRRSQIDALKKKD